MRTIVITIMSLTLTAFTISNAYYQRKQFYPSIVYLTKSNSSLAVIYIQCLIIVALIAKLLRRIFFGELRAAELEHLMERSWYAVTETCLAFTVFRDDFNPKFLALFTLLLFLKAFHWLADERVDLMERSPIISWIFHVRVVSLLLMLAILDFLFAAHSYQLILIGDTSVQLIFSFEYAILFTIVLNIFIKYAFHLNDFRELPWENKTLFLLYTELIISFLKVIIYLSFVYVMVRSFTLPLFVFRPMYYTFQSFKKAINDIIMSHRAIRNMNIYYPDATAEELITIDNICIICREEMRTAAKKLPCHHIFHSSCLRSWFQRQQTCPTCRFNVLDVTATIVEVRQAVRVVNDAAVGVQGGGMIERVQPNRSRGGTSEVNQIPEGRGTSIAAESTPKFINKSVQTNINLKTLQFLLTNQNDNTPTGTSSRTHLKTKTEYHLDKLNLEELKKLEEKTRGKLQWRIEYLTCVRAMLENANVMMQLYADLMIQEESITSRINANPLTAPHCPDEIANESDNFTTSDGAQNLELLPDSSDEESGNETM